MKLLTLDKLNKRFGKRIIIDSLTYSFPTKGLVFISGDSGCGKSTLLNILSGCDKEYTGNVFFMGKALNEQDDDSLAEIRLRNFGFVRQSYDLLEMESVFYNASLTISGIQLKKKQIKRKTDEVLSYLGLKEKSKQRVNTLSGGEKQRVAIARALVSDPKIILADEPTGALDSSNATTINKILKDVSKKCLVIVVSHDLLAAKKYADVILRMENGKIDIVKNEALETVDEGFVTYRLKEKNKTKWKLSLWLKHASNLMNGKRMRSMIMNGIITFSLLSLGLSLFVQRDLENQITSLFSSISGINGIVMESASKNENTFGKIISASEENIFKLENDYPDLIERHGINYLCSYENYFKDENQMYFDSFGEKKIIPSLGVRNINEYQWLEDVDEDKVFPEKPKVMENEQIVLSIPYSTMINMCLSLHIERSYFSLGNYLKRKPLEVFLETANNSWGYSDLQLFSLIGVLESEIPTIYHSRRDWNEYVLEESMGFPTSDMDDESLPWILRKTYYIMPKQNKESFFMAARENGILDRYVFESDSYLYDQTHNSKRKTSKSKKLYVYQADKIALSYSMINDISSTYSLGDYSVFGESSYLCYPSAMISGFAFPFLLSNEEEKLNNFVESLDSLPQEESFLNVGVPKEIVSGYYLKGANDSLNISSDFSQLIEGKKPENSNQVCVSTALMNRLGKSNSLYCAGVISQEENKNQYRLGQLEVTGVVKDDKMTLYTSSSWSIDYFRDYLGMSSFSLEPKKAVFYCDNNKAESLIKQLQAKYPSMTFTNPSLNVKSSIANIIEYASSILSFASAVTIITAFTLYFCSALLLIIENKKEIKLLHILGVSRSGIYDSLCSNLFLTTLICSFLGIISLAFAELTLTQTLSLSFGTSLIFSSIDIFPHCIMLVFSFAVFILSALALHFWLRRKRLDKE